MEWKLKWHYIGIIDALLRDTCAEANSKDFITYVHDKSSDWHKAVYTGSTVGGIDGKAELLATIHNHVDLTNSPFAWTPSEFGELDIKVTKSTGAAQTEITLSHDTLYLPWELFTALWATYGGTGSLNGSAHVADRPTFSAQAHVRTRAVLDTGDRMIECEGVNQTPLGGMRAAIAARASSLTQYASYAQSLGDYQSSSIASMPIASTYFKPGTGTRVKLVLGLKKSALVTLGDKELIILAPAYPCGALNGNPRCP